MPSPRRSPRTIDPEEKHGDAIRFKLPKPPKKPEEKKTRTPPKQIKKGTPQDEGMDITFLIGLSNIKPKKAEYSDVSLYKYVKEILKTFLKDDIINVILNKSTMKTWIKCFTHVTYDPNNDKNYDSLEAVGDKVLSLAFKSHLHKKYKKISASSLNNLDQFYMSTYRQSIIADKMGLANWLRIRGNVNLYSEKVKEDLMEAFFGAFEEIFIENKNYGPGWSSKVTSLFFDKLFKDIEFDLDTQIPTTYNEQLFQQFGCPSSCYSKKEEHDKNNGLWTVTATITKVGVDLLKGLGKDIGNIPLSFSSKMRTLKPARLQANQKMLKFFKENKLSPNEVKELKHEKWKETVNYDKILSNARKVDKRIHEVSVDQVFGKDESSFVYQVIGKMKIDGKVEYIVLMTKSATAEENSGKRDKIINISNEFANL
jgi:dsRNA-specific ribonuclease